MDILKAQIQRWHFLFKDGTPQCPSLESRASAGGARSPQSDADAQDIKCSQRFPRSECRQTRWESVVPRVCVSPTHMT